jgi:hypothetical protein
VSLVPGAGRGWMKGDGGDTGASPPSSAGRTD